MDGSPVAPARGSGNRAGTLPELLSGADGRKADHERRHQQAARMARGGGEERRSGCFWHRRERVARRWRSRPGGSELGLDDMSAAVLWWPYRRPETRQKRCLKLQTRVRQNF